MILSFKKTVKGGIGVCLVPFALLSMGALSVFVCKISWFRYPNYLCIVGFTIYVLVFMINRGQSLLYVIGHEALHGLSSILFGGKVVSFFVSQTKGFVKVTHTNFIVSLIPYCIPFYAFFIFFCYFLMSLLGPTKEIVPWLLFLFGGALAHHILFTGKYLRIGQRDVYSQGKLFSFTIIAIVNSLSFSLVMSIFFIEVSMQEVLVLSVRWGQQVVDNIMG